MPARIKTCKCGIKYNPEEVRGEGCPVCEDKRKRAKLEKKRQKQRAKWKEYQRQHRAKIII